MMTKPMSDAVGSSAANGWASFVVSQHRSLVWSRHPSKSPLPAVHHDLSVVNGLRERLASYACVMDLFEAVPFVKSVTVSMEEPPSWEDAGSSVLLNAEIELDVGLARNLKVNTEDMREVSLEDWLDESGVSDEDLPRVLGRLAEHEPDIEKFVRRLSNGATPWFDRAFWVSHGESSESFTRGGFEAAFVDGALDSQSFCNGWSAHIDFSQPRSLWLKDSVARMRLHLDAGMGVEARDLTGVTPLIAAVHHGDVDAVSMLLEAGADVHALTPAGTNAMTAAVLCVDLEMVDMLLAAGADISGVKMAPTHLLVAGGHVFSETLGRDIDLPEFFEALIDRGLDIAQVMPDGVRFCDALNSYCRPGEVGMIQYLSALRAKLDLLSEFGGASEGGSVARRASAGLGL